MGELSETGSGDSETALLVMSCSKNVAIMAPLHQMRVSQIPLRPSEHATVNIDTRNAFCPINNQVPRSGPTEMQSSLDHVRYNIVGKCCPLFHPTGGAELTTCNRRAAMQTVYHQTSSRIDGVWSTNAQDR